MIDKKFYKNWRMAIIKSSYTIKNAIQNLNKTALQICFVYKKNKFYGTLTDGDIRRGLVKGYELNSEIDLVVNKNPKFILEKDLNKKKFVNKFSKNINTNLSYYLIPIINYKKKNCRYFKK